MYEGSVVWVYEGSVVWPVCVQGECSVACGCTRGV